MSKRLTGAEIAEVWQRSNAGEPTRSIARRLRRNGSSIRRLFEDAGGVHPAPRKRSVRHLSLHDSWNAIDRHVSSGLVKPAHIGTYALPRSEEEVAHIAGYALAGCRWFRGFLRWCCGTTWFRVAFIG